jgi:hypothetical protein
MPRYHVGGDFEHIEPMLREAHALEPDNSTISRGLALVLQAYTRARARTNARAHTRVRAHARARTHITVLQERAIAWRDDRAAEDAEALLAALADENAADAGVWFDLGAFYDSCRSAGLCVRWAISWPSPSAGKSQSQYLRGAAVWSPVPREGAPLAHQVPKAAPSRAAPPLPATDIGGGTGRCT